MLQNQERPTLASAFAGATRRAYLLLPVADRVLVRQSTAGPRLPGVAVPDDERPRAALSRLLAELGVVAARVTAVASTWSYAPDGSGRYSDTVASFFAVEVGVAPLAPLPGGFTWLPLAEAPLLLGEPAEARAVQALRDQPVTPRQVGSSPAAC